MNLLLIKPNFSNSSVYLNQQTLPHSRFDLPKDTVSFGMGFGRPKIDGKKYNEGEDNVVIKGDLLPKAKHSNYKIGENVEVKGNVKSNIGLDIGENFKAQSINAPKSFVKIDDDANISGAVLAKVLMAEYNFTADSVEADNIAISGDINVKNIIANEGSVELGNIDALDSITLAHSNKRGRIGSLILPSVSHIKPEKITVYLGELQGLDIIEPKGNKNILDKLKFVDMETGDVIEAKGHPLIRVKSHEEAEA